MDDRKVRCAIIGYGTTFTWGWVHARWIEAVEELDLVAICDKDTACAEKSKSDFPGIKTYTDMHAMLRKEDIDMVSVVTPHNTHASIVIECLNEGKHVVVDKPMCISVKEATEMIETAGKVDKTLAVFHNRRHDGNVRAIKEVIELGEIGDVFHIELSACGYGHPENSWRSRKEISGGALYDWGAHAIDWVLHLIPSKIAQVTGFFHKLLWHDVTSEDQARAIILFENGAVADIVRSSIAYAGKPLWRILGTKGAIVDTGRNAIEGYVKKLAGPSGGAFNIVTAEGEREIRYRKSDWNNYYVDMADHLTMGTPVPISGEDGRRVITVLETAEKSAKSGRSQDVPYQ